MENNEREALLAQVRRRYEILAPDLTEQTKRVWAAAEALTIGRGGQALVSVALGISRPTVTKATQEVLSPAGVPCRHRRRGGGRKPLVATDETLREAVDALIDPRTRGAPESPFRWTSKSPYH